MMEEDCAQTPDLYHRAVERSTSPDQPEWAVASDSPHFLSCGQQLSPNPLRSDVWRSSSVRGHRERILRSEFSVGLSEASGPGSSSALASVLPSILILLGPGMILPAKLFLAGPATGMRWNNIIYASSMQAPSKGECSWVAGMRYHGKARHDIPSLRSFCVRHVG